MARRYALKELPPDSRDLVRVSAAEAAAMAQAAEAAEAIAVVNRTAPNLPRVVVEAKALPARPAPVVDKVAMLGIRLHESTLTAMAQAARQAGLTQRAFVARALLQAGVEVAPPDLEDTSRPRR